MTQAIGETTSSDESVTEAVVAAVAEAEGADPTDLDPLFGVIDPDALEALVAPGIDGHVAFDYHGHRVVVEGTGDVRLDSEAEASSSSAV